MKRTILALALAVFALPAAAQSNWTGTSSSNWSDPTNWQGGVAPVSSNTLQLVFSGLGATGVTVADAPYTCNQLTISSPPAYSLSGNPLTFDGAGPQILVSGNGNTIANPLLFNVDTVLGAFNDVTLSGGTGGQALIMPIPGTVVTLTGLLVHSGFTAFAGTLRIGDGVTGPNLFFDIFDNGALELNPPAPLTLNGVLSGSGTVRAVGGTTSGASAWTHAGTTTVDAGATVNASVNNNALLTVNGDMTIDNSTVGSLTGTTSGTLLINSGTLTLGGDNTSATYLGAILGGAGGVTKVGTGRQVLAQQLTYSGPTLVSAGTLAIGNGTLGTVGLLFAPTTNAALEIDALGGMNLPDGLTGSGTLTILSGTTTSPVVLTHAGATTVNSGATLTAAINNNALLTVEGTFAAPDSTAGSLAGTGTGSVLINGAALTLGGDNTDQTYVGGMGGGGGIIKNGTGRQTLALTTIYFGNTTINGGTLRFGNGVVAGLGFVFNTITDNGAIEFNTPGAVGVNPFGGSGTVRVLSGTLNTNGTLTHAGTTTIDAGGSLTGAVNNNALLTVNGTANLTAQPTTVGSLTGSGVMNINASTFTVGGDNTSTTYTGTFGVGGNLLVKVGTGTLTLTGNSGGVVAASKVNAGTLLVNGQHIASNTQVASGATLGGSGTVGPVIVNAGGFLSPGNSPGLLTTASLFLGGTLLQEIQGNVRGTQYDAIDANGAVNLTGATLTLSGAYVPVVGDTFTIIANDGVDPVVGTFAGLAQGATVNFNGRPLTISYTGGTGNDVVLAALAPAPALAAAPVPSNSAWMLAVLAAMLLASGIAAARGKLRRAR